MTTEKSLKLTLAKTPGRTYAQDLAATIIKPEVNAGIVVKAFNILPSDSDDLTEIVNSVQDVVNRVKAGDLSDVEGMLVSQAAALQSIFTTLSIRALEKSQLQQYDAFMRMAFKAQSQCRATLQTLLELKFPRTTAFVKQANITSGPQQINNEINPDQLNNHAREKKVEQSKLSKIEDTRYERKPLDVRGAAAAGGTDQGMEAVGKVYRAEKRRRKADGVQKQL